MQIAILTYMPQGGKGDVIRLRITNEQSLQYVKRLVRDMTHGFSVYRRPDLDQSPSEDENET